MNKQEKERLFFNLFCSAYNIIPFNLDQPKPPQPDIVFQYKNKTIGIELTELNDALPGHNSHKNHTEAHIKYIVKQVENIISKSYPVGLLVFINFNINILLNRKVVESVIEFICNQILTAAVTNNYITEIDFTKEVFEIELNFYNISIIRPFGNMDKTCVTPSLAFFPPSLNSLKINAVIEGKAMTKYDLTNIHEMWLLIHIGHSNATEFNIVPPIDINKWNFDKVFIFDVQIPKYLEY